MSSRPQSLAPSASVQSMQTFDDRSGGEEVVILVFGGAGVIVKCCVGTIAILEECRVGVTVIIGDGVGRGIVLKALLGGGGIDNDKGS